MRIRHAAGCLLAALVTAACGGGPGESAAAAADLTVAPQNTTYVAGLNRVTVALFRGDQKPVTAATGTTFEIQGAGPPFESGPLEDIGPQYGQIPVYVGAARLPRVGQYRLTVRATLSGGMRDSGSAVITVVDRSPEIPVGARVPPLRQPLAGDPGVKITDIDSGVPPDAWHTTSIADGLAQHRPMVLYFGEPGFCRSRMCGPTVQVLQSLCAQYCDRFTFEHIEDNYPAGPDETSKPNPAFAAFGFQSEPWIYFVNSTGVVADRYEGPVTLTELRASAEGTLAGRVPAVDIGPPG